MTEQLTEAVSALRDGELDAERAESLLRGMTRDPELRDQWERIQLIGDAMRGDYHGLDASRISDRVASALADEPVLLAPAAISPARKTRENWKRPLWAAGLAASLAGGVMLMMPQGSNVSPSGQLAAVPVSEQDPVPIASLPPSRQPAQRVEVGEGTHWNNLGQGSKVASKLNEYLMDHGEVAGSFNMGRVGSYASFVSFDD